MGDNKGKMNPKSPNKKISTPTKQDTKNTKSPLKSKNSTPSRSDKTSVKNKKTPTKESTADKKTPVKTSNSENKTPIKSSEKKTPVKSSNADKKTSVKNSTASKKPPTKESSAQNKTPVRNSPEKKKSLSTINETDTSIIRRGKREGLPLSRVRTIMKTARYAEAISPDAVQLTAIAAELFLKYLMQGVHAEAISMKKKKIDYNGLASYVNNEEEEHLEFLRVLIPHKITVAEYKKLMSESSKNVDKLDFLVSESEESGSEEEDSSEESSEGEDEEDEESDDVQEIPTPQKTSAKKTAPSPKKAVTKKGKVETVDLCESSSEEDFIILDGSKKEVGESSKNVIIL